MDGLHWYMNLRVYGMMVMSDVFDIGISNQLGYSID